jgi:hypothetical protein
LIIVDRDFVSGNAFTSYKGVRPSREVLHVFEQDYKGKILEMKKAATKLSASPF